MDLIEATLEAARMRLRPILMTSLAFTLGVLPLAIATGAGSGSQNAIGTGVLGGMIAGDRARHLLRAAVLRGDQAHFQGQARGGKCRCRCRPAGGQ